VASEQVRTARAERILKRQGGDDHVIELPRDGNGVRHEVDRHRQVGDEAEQNELAPTRNLLVADQPPQPHEAVGKNRARAKACVRLAATTRPPIRARYARTAYADPDEQRFDGGHRPPSVAALVSAPSGRVETRGAAALATPDLASLADRGAGDQKRGERVQPPPAEERIAGQAEEDRAGEIGADQVLRALAVRVSRGRVGNRPPASPRRGLGAGRLLVSDHRGQGVIHILVQDAAATRAALSEAGIEVSGERDVLVVDVEDRPGTMGESRAGSGRPA
jgi:hypothetical protein